MAFFIRYLDSHGILAGNRRDDPHTGNSQGDRQIICKARNPRESQAGFQFDFVLSDDGTGFDLDHFDLKTEVLECLFQDPRFATDLLFLVIKREIFTLDQKVDVGQLVIAIVFLKTCLVQLLNDLLAFVLFRGLVDAQRRGRLAHELANPGFCSGDGFDRRIVLFRFLVVLFRFLVVLVLVVLLVVIFLLGVVPFIDFLINRGFEPFSTDPDGQGFDVLIHVVFRQGDTVSLTLGSIDRGATHRGSGLEQHVVRP